MVHLNIFTPINFQVTALKLDRVVFHMIILKVRTHRCTHTDHAKNAGTLQSLASRKLQTYNPMKYLTYKAFQDKSMPTFLEQIDWPQNGSLEEHLSVHLGVTA